MKEVRLMDASIPGLSLAGSTGSAVEGRQCFSATTLAVELEHTALVSSTGYFQFLFTS